MGVVEIRFTKSLHFIDCNRAPSITLSWAMDHPCTQRIQSRSWESRSVDYYFNKYLFGRLSTAWFARFYCYAKQYEIGVVFHCVNFSSWIIFPHRNRKMKMNWIKMSEKKRIATARDHDWIIIYDLIHTNQCCLLCLFTSSIHTDRIPVSFYFSLFCSSSSSSSLPQLSLS